MNEDDKKAFLEDYKKADVSKKLDMWYHALDQGALWEEIIAEMATIAQAETMGKSKAVAEE